MNSRSAIPLIDFDCFLHGSSEDRRHVASTIDAALSSVGFIYLSNHGIDQSKVDECLSWSKRFFALSESEKPERSHHRGYSKVGNEKVREMTCIKEGFDCGNPEDDTQPNIWPSEELLPGFRDFIEMFWQKCSKLVHRLLDCLSLALELHSTNSLVRYHSGSHFDLSLLHYPAASTSLLRSGKLTRIPAHSDFGTLTLLFQDDVGGLEIADTNCANTQTSAGLESSGKFRHVEPKPGTVMVNVGYLLMRWSNGRWKNTIHRVMEPPSSLKEQASDDFESPKAPRISDGGANDMTPARYSIPFFAAPDPATIVEALPGCWSESVPKKWKAISAGAYLRRKRENKYV